MRSCAGVARGGGGGSTDQERRRKCTGQSKSISWKMSPLSISKGPSENMIVAFPFTKLTPRTMPGSHRWGSVNSTFTTSFCFRSSTQMSRQLLGTGLRTRGVEGALAMGRNATPDADCWSRSTSGGRGPTSQVLFPFVVTHVGQKTCEVVPQTMNKTQDMQMQVNATSVLEGKQIVDSRNVLKTGEAGFSFPGGGGGVDRALRPDPPHKKGSIDRTPKILPSLTPRPWR